MRILELEFRLHPSTNLWLQTDMNQIVQMSTNYYKSLNVNWLQSYEPSKLAVKIDARSFGFKTTIIVSL